MARVKVNGVSLNLVVQGHGPSIVALHGFTGDLKTWHAFAQAAGREYTLVLIDLLGHGRSSCPPDPQRYHMEQCIEDLLGVLNSLGIHQAIWLGYSMGARIALGVGMAAPERCQALVLEGGSPGLADPRECAQRVASDEHLARMIEKAGVPQFVDFWEARPLFASQVRLSQRERTRIRTQRLRNSPVGLANSLRGIGAGAQPPLHHRLPSLAPPALFIAGGEDNKFRDIAQTMCSRVPNGRVAVIPEAGHAAHIEQPDLFNSTVLAFLRGLPGVPDEAPKAGAHKASSSGGDATKVQAVPTQRFGVQADAQARSLGNAEQATHG